MVFYVREDPECNEIVLLQDIKITFKRDYLYYVTQPFFMSFMLGMLAYFTFMIDIEDFTDRYVFVLK